MEEDFGGNITIVKSKEGGMYPEEVLKNFRWIASIPIIGLKMQITKNILQHLIVMVK